MEQIMRICEKCHKEKNLNEFCKCKSRYLGRTYICRECEVLRWRARSNTKEYQNKRAIYRQTGEAKKKRQNRMRLDYKENPQKYLAKRLVEERVKTGEMERKPCEKCENPSSMGHHQDYSKPLEVIWLCHKHHAQIHSEYGPIIE